MWKVDCGLRVVLFGVCVLQEESTSGKQKKDNEATWKQQVCSFLFFPVHFHSDGFCDVLAVHCVDESGQQR